MPANHELIEDVLRSGDDKAVESLLGDEDTILWIDWRHEDDAIVEDCESLLKTAALFAEVVDSPAGEWELYILYNAKRQKVPLEEGAQDRHITLLTLNRVLSPDFEIRFCIASNGSDTLAFLPLPSNDWAQFECRYGHAVAKHFYKIAAKPNLFTDVLDF